MFSKLYLNRDFMSSSKDRIKTRFVQNHLDSPLNLKFKLDPKLLRKTRENWK